MADSAGIQFLIPGTGYAALSESNGKFQLDDVPVVVHHFYFEKDDFYRGQIEVVAIDDQTPSHTLADVVLILGTGVERAMV